MAFVGAADYSKPPRGPNESGLRLGHHAARFAPSVQLGCHIGGAFGNPKTKVAELSIRRGQRHPVPVAVRSCVPSFTGMLSNTALKRDACRQAGSRPLAPRYAFKEQLCVNHNL